MADDPWEEIFTRLAELRDGFPARGWTYDRRLRCVTVAFPASDEPRAQAAVDAVMPASWTAGTLADAPAEVRALVGACGGLRAGQKISWGGGEPGAAGPGPFGLWWPWGDATTISLRIGLHDLDQPKVRYPRLRDIFGIPQAPAQD